MPEKILGVGALRRLAILGRQAFLCGGLKWHASLPSAPSYYLWMSFWLVESLV
jgi:hypothetical protein